MRILIVAGMVLFRLRFPRCQSDTLNQQRAGDHLLLPGYFVGRALLLFIFTPFSELVAIGSVFF
jgi:hypothetical protein